MKKSREGGRGPKGEKVRSVARKMSKLKESRREEDLQEEIERLEEYFSPCILIEASEDDRIEAKLFFKSSSNLRMPGGIGPSERGRGHGEGGPARGGIRKSQSLRNCKSFEKIRHHRGKVERKTERERLRGRTAKGRGRCPLT